MKTRKSFTALALLLLCALPYMPAVAEVCDPRIQATAPVARFSIANNDTVQDLWTNLTWQRCPVGTVLDDNDTPTIYTDDSCLEDSAETFSWQEALNYAENLNAAGGFGGRIDWRVPNVKELLSLVERQCTSPAINSTVFPDTTTKTSFWSSTPNTTSAAFILRFRDGTPRTNGGNRSTDTNALRLVSGNRFE